jgi:hypothetical protein
MHARFFWPLFVHRKDGSDAASAVPCRHFSLNIGIEARSRERNWT